MVENKEIYDDAEFAAAVLAALGDGITVHDRNYRIVYQNSVIQRAFGNRVGDHCYEAYEGRSAMCPGCPVAECFADGGIYSAERSVLLNGKRLVVQNTASPVRDRDGRIVAAVEVVRDITPKKVADEKLLGVSNLYDALSRTNKAIMLCRDRDTLFREICEIAVSHGKFCLAMIVLNDPESGFLLPAAYGGRAEGYAARVKISSSLDRADGRGPTGIAIRLGLPYICNDFYADPITIPWRAAAMENGIHASAAFPLKANGVGIGALKVYSEQKEFFDEEMVALLVEMAANISFALDNFSREERRKGAEEALRQSEERLQLVLEGSNDGFWDLDLVTDVIKLSNRYYEMLGHAPGEIEPTGAALRLLVHPDDQGRVRLAFTEHLACLTGGYEVEYRLRTKSGDWLWVVDRGKVVARDADGGALRVAGTCRNIDERKKYEDELRHISTHDGLTGLFNRAYFDAEMMRMARSRSYPVSIVAADVDGLKLVNDSFGHAEGDTLIRLAAQVLREAFRAEDVVARIGGDEFVVLLPDTDAETAKDGVKRLERCINQLNEGCRDYSLSLSVGAATAERPEQLKEALKLADSRMYYYKFQKKSRRV